MAIFIAVALLAPVIEPYDPNALDLSVRLQGFSLTHFLGTDALGRLAQVCEGFLLSQMDRRFHTLEFYKQVRGRPL